jgi:hypothetical protein
VDARDVLDASFGVDALDASNAADAPLLPDYADLGSVADLADGENARDPLDPSDAADVFGADPRTNFLAALSVAVSDGAPQHTLPLDVSDTAVTSFAACFPESVQSVALRAQPSHATLPRTKLGVLWFGTRKPQQPSVRRAVNFTRGGLPVLLRTRLTQITAWTAGSKRVASVAYAVNVTRTGATTSCPCAAYDANCVACTSLPGGAAANYCTFCSGDYIIVSEGATTSCQLPSPPPADTTPPPTDTPPSSTPPAGDTPPAGTPPAGTPPGGDAPPSGTPPGGETTPEAAAAPPPAGLTPAASPPPLSSAATVTVTVALALTIDLANYNESGMVAELMAQFGSLGNVQIVIDDYESACVRACCGTRSRTCVRVACFTAVARSLTVR